MDSFVRSYCRKVSNEQGGRYVANPSEQRRANAKGVNEKYVHTSLTLGAMSLSKIDENFRWSKDTDR